MRIVNREEFLNLPDGTLYSVYESFGSLNGLFLKVGTTRYGREDSTYDDWLYHDLTNTILSAGDTEFFEIFSKAETDSSLQFQLEPDAASRDGAYKEDQKFAVYDYEDVGRLVVRVMDIFANYPNHLKET